MGTRPVTRTDYHDLIRIREEWLDNFYRVHPASERWCPAVSRVPRIENEHTFFDHFSGKNSRWAALQETDGEIRAYLLCQEDAEKDELVIEEQTPRVDPGATIEATADELIEFAVHRAQESGLKQVSVSFHGFADEVDPLMDAFRRNRFECEPWYEMVSDNLTIEVDPQPFEFRSAAQIGREAFFASGAALGKWPSASAAKEDCEFSERMWGSVDPDRDWLVAYDGGQIVGNIRAAVNREGLGVVDDIVLAREYRGRGLGRCLLARCLAAVAGRAKRVYLDVVQSNTPAVRLYRSAGFRVHHHHGGMKRMLK